MGAKPMSLADLGRRLASSRQAVHETVTEPARRGILQVNKDPAQRNSASAVYIDKGQVNRVGAALIAQIETRVAQRLGEREFSRLKQLPALPWD
jgi:hypothetical protein